MFPKTKLKKTILIVEDNEDIRFFYSKLLKREGFSVLEAVDGPNALRCLNGEQGTLPDLMVLDLGIPGGQILENLNKSLNSKLKKIPILVSSGWPGSNKIALKMGANACLPKPVDISQFLKTVNNLIAH